MQEQFMNYIFGNLYCRNKEHTEISAVKEPNGMKNTKLYVFPSTLTQIQANIHAKISQLEMESAEFF